MPRFHITAPDGATYEIDAPEGASEADALSHFQANFRPSAPAAPRQPSSADLAARDARARDRSVGGMERAALQGVTFGFGDEIDAGAAAASTWVHDKASRALGGRGVPYSAREAYDAVAAKDRADEKAYRDEHPLLAGGSELVGGIATGKGVLKAAQLAREALTGGRAAQAAVAASRLARVRNGAATGAAMGGAYGAGNADDGDRMAGAGRGAVGGLVLGGAAPLVMEGLGTVAAPVAEALSPQIAATRAALAAAGRRATGGNAIRQAGRIVGGNANLAYDAGAAVREGLGAGRQAAAVSRAERLTRPELKAARALNAAMEADARSGSGMTREGPLYLTGGGNVRGLAEAVATHPGPGLNILSEAADANQTANLRGYEEDLARHMGGRGDYFATMRNAKGARAASGKPLIEEAFSEPVDADAFERSFGDLSRRLPRGTMQKAADLARMAGHDPHDLGLVTADTFGGHAGGGSPGDVSAEELASIMRGRPPARQPSRGPTLARFLADRGGLTDDGGELADMGAHRWHDGKPFAPRLVRDDGRGLDDAAQAAHEAGYWPERMAVDDASASHHPVSPDDVLEAIRDEMRGHARYARSAQGPSRAEWDHDAERRVNVGGDLERDAANEAFAGGEGPAMSPDELLPVEVPSLRALHYVKKGLDATLAPRRNAFGHLDLEGDPEAQAISGLRRDWGRQMRAVSPKYDQAMDQWGDESEAIDALKLGRNVLSGHENMRAENLAHEHGQLSDGAKAWFQKGVGEALLDAAKTKGGLNGMRSLLRNRDVAERVRLAFPTEDAFNDFMATTRQRVGDEAQHAAMNGNSRSAYRLAAQRMAEGGDDFAGTLLRDVVKLQPRVGLGRLVDRMMPGREAGALTDPAANEALARALSDPAQADRIRRLMALQRARALSLTSGTGGQVAATASGQTGGARQ